MLRRWLSIALLAATIALPVHAVEIHGVQVSGNAQVEAGNLVLNGAGVRTKFFVKVYVGALYLAEKKTSAEAALTETGPKRMELRILHGMSAEKLTGALDEGMAANNAAADLTALEAELKQFRSLIAAGGAVKDGDTIQLDYLPASGTRVVWNGKVLGVVAGEKFNRALLKVWLGDHPVDGSLKKALLGF